MKKGHKYVTVVLDLESGAVVFVGDGKGADALKRFWKRLCHSPTKVEAVAIAMSPVCMSAVLAHLLGAAIVFDHFHVVKLFNHKLSDLRRNLYRGGLKGSEICLRGFFDLTVVHPRPAQESAWGCHAGQAHFQGQGGARRRRLSAEVQGEARAQGV